MTRPTVLIAEDHEAVAEQLRSVLQAECDVVGVVRDGRSLILAVDADMPEVIVSDVTMPGMDGLTAAQQILRRHPGACIVFVTVHDDPCIVRRAVGLGALGYVLKGDAAEELLVAVHSARARHLHLSTNIKPL